MMLRGFARIYCRLPFILAVARKKVFKMRGRPQLEKAIELVVKVQKITKALRPAC